jgi:protein-tyrosine phosphatase
VAFDVDAKSLERLLAVDADYLNAAFEQIHSQYGSVQSYVEQALLLNTEKVNRLRTKFLA